MPETANQGGRRNLSKSIIILGTGNTCVYCDFGWKDGKLDPDSRVYGVNGAYTIPQIMPPDLRDKFRMHKLFMTDYTWSETGTLNFHPDDINNFSAKHGTQVISLHPHVIGKHSMNEKRYPYRRICAKFHNNYFTDTICYMIAYALDQYTVEAISAKGTRRLELTEPLTLRFFGVDMCTTLEYYLSKCGIEFWIGWAFSLGCEVQITNGSVLMMHPRGIPYGFRLKKGQPAPDLFGMLRANEEASRLNNRSGRRSMEATS